MRKFKIWTAGVVSILLLIVVIQNTGEVAVSFLWMGAQMPMLLMLLLVGLLGVTLGVLLGLLYARRRDQAKL